MTVAGTDAPDLARESRCATSRVHGSVDGAPFRAQVERVGLGATASSHDGAQVEVRVLSPRAAELHALMPFKPPPDLSRFLLSPMPGLLVEVAVKAGPGGAGRRAAGRDRGDEDGEHRSSPRSDGVVARRCVATQGESLAVDQVILEFASAARLPTHERSGGAAVPRARHPADRDRRPEQGARCARSGSTCFGLEVTGNFRSERENVDEDICALGSGPRTGRGRPDGADRSRQASRRCTRRRSTTSACGSTTCRGAVAWLDGATACASRRAASARARPATTSASSTRRRTTRFRSRGEGVLIELVQAPPDVIAAWRAAQAEGPR